MSIKVWGEGMQPSNIKIGTPGMSVEDLHNASGNILKRYTVYS